MQLPPVEPGSVVVRGPDWKYRAQDSHGRGITLGPVDSDGWLTVLWHNGQENKYRWGAQNGKRDIRVLSPEEAAAPPTAVPDNSTDGSALRPGTIVVRGPDWRWAEQDGGEGCKGKTVGCVGDFAAGWVEVKWMSNGDSYRYRYGADDSFDICVAEGGGGGGGASAASATGAGTSTGPASSPATLTVGSRVMRGPDWIWGDAQNQNGLGTVISELGTEAGGSGWVRVKWDKTLKENNYRYGEGGAYDLCVVQESEPQQSSLAFGTVVEPGADWKWGNQHGGGTGSVVGESTPGWVRVRWTKGGQTNSYRYGADGAFDIKAVAQTVRPVPIGAHRVTRLHDIISTSLHSHPLTKRLGVSWGCDGRRQLGGCRSGSDGSGFRSKYSWRCAQCDFDLCVACAAEAAGVACPSPLLTCASHPHPLTKRIAPYRETRFICNSGHDSNCCESGTSDGSGHQGFTWHCLECQYDLCTACALGMM